MPTTDQADKTRVNVGLPGVVVSMLKDLQQRLHLNQTQAVREAIEFRHMIQEKVDDGATVVLERPSPQGIERTLLWMPPSHNRAPQRSYEAVPAPRVEVEV